jgi:hypothetical protein
MLNVKVGDSVFVVSIPSSCGRTDKKYASYEPVTKVGRLYFYTGSG